MASVIEKIKGLLKGKAEKSKESVPQQEKPEAEQKPEEQAHSPEEAVSD